VLVGFSSGFVTGVLVSSCACAKLLKQSKHSNANKEVLIGENFDAMREATIRFDIR